MFAKGKSDIGSFRGNTITANCSFPALVGVTNKKPCLFATYLKVVGNNGKNFKL
ncbi:hypothetical protein ACVW0P_004129 [Mucilaginibacter sp. UYNi724]